MRMFFTAFGLHNPFVRSRLPGHGIMPISTDVEDGLDLDYSALLIAESFYMDRSAYEHIWEQRTGVMGPMWRSIHVLREEGFLECVDYGVPVADYEREIVEKTSQLVETIEPWLLAARRQWA